MSSSQIKTARLMMRPWYRDEGPALMRLTSDPGCQAPWGLFKTPLDAARAGQWIDRASDTMMRLRLGSWAVEAGDELVGCANLVHRHLDGSTESLATLEFRFKQAGYAKGLAAEAGMGLLEFGRSQHKIEHFHLFVAAQDHTARGLAEALGFTIWKKSKYEGVAVDVYSNRPPAGAGRPPQPAGAISATG